MYLTSHHDTISADFLSGKSAGENGLTVVLHTEYQSTAKKGRTQNPSKYILQQTILWLAI